MAVKFLAGCCCRDECAEITFTASACGYAGGDPLSIESPFPCWVRIDQGGVEYTSIWFDYSGDSAVVETMPVGQYTAVVEQDNWFMCQPFTVDSDCDPVSLLIYPRHYKITMRCRPCGYVCMEGYDPIIEGSYWEVGRVGGAIITTIDDVLNAEYVGEFSDCENPHEELEIRWFPPSDSGYVSPTPEVVNVYGCYNSALVTFNVEDILHEDYVCSYCCSLDQTGTFCISSTAGYPVPRTLYYSDDLGLDLELVSGGGYWEGEGYFAVDDAWLQEGYGWDCEEDSGDVRQIWARVYLIPCNGMYCDETGQHLGEYGDYWAVVVHFNVCVERAGEIITAVHFCATPFSPLSKMQAWGAWGEGGFCSDVRPLINISGTYNLPVLDSILPEGSAVVDCELVPGYGGTVPYLGIDFTISGL